MKGKCPQYQLAAHALWDKLTGAGYAIDGGSRAQAGPRARTAYVHQRSTMPKLLGGLLITLAILAITYSAAASLVNGAASKTHARTNYAVALQQAAADYRRTRAQCQRLPANGRDVCVVEAHAAEGRARAMAVLAPDSYVAALRSQTNAAIDAADGDSIVIEPACNVVSRGQESVCEIQVTSNAANAMAEGARKPLLIQAHANPRPGESGQLVQARANVQTGTNGASMQARGAGDARHHKTYFFNVAAASPW